MAEIPTPEQFCLHTPLYEMFQIQSWNFKKVIELDLFTGTLDTYCVQCGKEGIFSVVSVPGVFRDHPEHIGKFPIQGQQGKTVEGAESFRLRLGSDPDSTKEYAISDRVFGIVLRCSRDATHKLYYFFSVQDAKIIKIGQYPSLADLQEWEIRKYRKILGDDKYREFSKAVGLSAHGIGIGAFVYLRRIFEGLIEEAHAEAQNSPDWVEEDFAKARMDEKIQSLQAFLPDTLLQHSSLYSVLSKGIHILDEEECQGYFEPMRVGIELILDEKIEKQEKVKKGVQLDNTLATIKRELKA